MIFNLLSSLIHFSRVGYYLRKGNCTFLLDCNAFGPRDLANIKYTTRTVYHLNSPNQTIQFWDIYQGHALHIYIFNGFFSERTIRKLAEINYFMHVVWNRFTINDREAVQSDIFLKMNAQILNKCHNYVHPISIDIHLWSSVQLPVAYAWHCLSLCAALSSNVAVWSISAMLRTTVKNDSVFLSKMYYKG